MSIEPGRAPVLLPRSGARSDQRRVALSQFRIAWLLSSNTSRLEPGGRPTPKHCRIRSLRRVQLAYASVEYDVEFRRHYVDLLRAVAKGGAEQIIERGIGFGLIDARESRETRDAFVRMLLNAAEPFEWGRQPFKFSDARYSSSSKEVVRRFVSSLRFSPPPRNLMFLHRKLGGLFQLLKRLEVELDLRPYWERMLSEPFERAPAPSAVTPASRSGSS